MASFHFRSSVKKSKGYCPEMKISCHMSAKIRRLSFIATTMVVFLHSYNKSLAASKDGSFTWWLQDLVSQGVTRVAVPYFFVVFGILLFKDWNDPAGVSRTRWWWGKIKGRSRSLVLPYLLWSMIGMIMIFALTRFAPNSPLRFNWSNLCWWLQTFGVSTDPMFMAHLWFVRAIIIFAITSVLIGFAVERFGIVVLAVVGIVAAFAPAFPYWLGQGLFFVCLGAFVALHQPDLLDIRCSRRWKAIAFAVIWLSLVGIKVFFDYCGLCSRGGWLSVGPVGLNLLFFANCVGILSLWQGYDIIRLDFLDRVAGASFFVYCSYAIAFGYVGATLKRVSVVGRSDLLMWFIVPIVVLSLCLVGWKILKSFFSRLYYYLGGGR